MENKISSLNFVKTIDTVVWNKMTASERLRYLQSVENEMAVKDGRKAAKVIPVPDDENRAGLLGYYNHEANVIAINPRYLKSKLNISGVAQFTLPNALQTIIHEGRHAWQHHVVAHPELGIVDEKTRLEIMMNLENYEGNAPLYSAQLIELDARLYAQQVLSQIAQELKASGKLEHGFERAVVKAKQEEVIRAISVLNNKEAVKMIAVKEKLAQDRSSKLHPDLDFTNVSHFNAIKKVIKERDINKVSDMEQIKVIKVSLDSSLDRLDIKVDKEKVSSKKKFL